MSVFKDLNNKKEFLEIQKSIVTERLKKYIETQKMNINECANYLKKIRTKQIDYKEVFQAYFFYRCEFFQQSCREMIECLIKNLILSSTKIDYNYFSNLFNIKYVFEILKNRIQPKDFAVEVCVQINTGEVFFLEDFLKKSEKQEKDGIEKKYINEEINNNEQNKNEKRKYRIIKKDNECLIIKRQKEKALNSAYNIPQNETMKNKLDENGITNLKYPTMNSSTKYVKNARDLSFKFSGVSFYQNEYPEIEKYFVNPFKIRICINELTRHTTMAKINTIFDKLLKLCNMEVDYLLKFSSYEYTKKFPYNELVRVAELNNLNEEVGERIKIFLKQIQDCKKMALLNLGLNLIPGLMYCVNFKEYKNLPNSYLVWWAELCKLKNKTNSSA